MDNLGTLISNCFSIPILHDKIKYKLSLENYPFVTMNNVNCFYQTRH